MGSGSDTQPCRGSARRQAQAEHKADVLAEENASLILELDARPTAKQYKSLQRQMDILERRLNESKAEAHGYARQHQDNNCIPSPLLATSWWCSFDMTFMCWQCSIDVMFTCWLWYVSGDMTLHAGSADLQ